MQTILYNFMNFPLSTREALRRMPYAYPPRWTEWDLMAINLKGVLKIILIMHIKRYNTYLRNNKCLFNTIE